MYESCSLRAWSSSTGVLILVCDYVRMVRLDGLLPCSEAGDAGEEAEVDEPIIDCGAQHATRAPGALPVRPVGLRWQLQGAPGEHQSRGRGQSRFRGCEGVRWALYTRKRVLSEPGPAVHLELDHARWRSLSLAINKGHTRQRLEIQACTCPTSCSFTVRTTHIRLIQLTSFHYFIKQCSSLGQITTCHKLQRDVPRPRLAMVWQTALVTAGSFSQSR